MTRAVWISESRGESWRNREWVPWNGVGVLKLLSTPLHLRGGGKKRKTGDRQGNLLPVRPEFSHL